MNPTVQLVCLPQWMNDELSQAVGFQVHHTFGFEVPDYAAADDWWVPQQLAVKIVRSMRENNLAVPNFTSPGPNWLPSVSSSFTQRDVEVFTAREAQIIERPAGWWKAAEAKVSSFEPKVRTHSQLTVDIAASNLLWASKLQYTERTLDIDVEYRFFVKNREALTGSAYLRHYLDGTNVNYYDGAETIPSELAEGKQFVNAVASATPSPKGYVMDVARLRDGSWVVLEANPAWCSAWYGSDITMVAETVHASFTETSPGWAWNPDPSHLVEAYRQVVLPLR